MKKLPKKCPACGGKIKLVTSCEDDTRVGWSCTKCNVFNHANYEHPEITRGRGFARSMQGTPCTSKSFTKLSGRTQLGILRHRQHYCEICKKLFDNLYKHTLKKHPDETGAEVVE